MTSEFNFDEFIQSLDSFGTESRSFQNDVYMLILTSLDAGLKLLNAETNPENDKLLQYVPTAKGEAAERLGEQQAELWIQLAQQETFLRNFALVALLSRLTHALLTMLRHAETWAPRDPQGYEGQDEFKRIWAEFRERFNINLGSRYIGWVESYRNARNLIVHNGGEANRQKPYTEINPALGDEGMYDLSFTKKYSAFVNGTGYSAEVVITEKLLDYAVKSAIPLVDHAAKALRKLELEHFERQSERRRANPGQPP